MSRATSDEAPAVAAAQGSRVDHVQSPDFPCCGAAGQAALTIEGEDYARAYLRRLHDDAVQPDELATLLTFLTGERLHGACRVLEKALRGGRHG
jgi:hypothetical protein